MNIQRKLLSAYRKLQYRLCGRSEYGVMEAGTLCTHTPYEEEINHGDVVHPCVRYIPEGYLGHKWWMVYTPYYASNDKTENPILCYGANESSEPPTHWIVAYQVQGQPAKGYNSDPTLFYDEGKLYVMWRENLTDRCEKAGFARATLGAEVLNDGIGEVFGPLVGTTDAEVDAETSPAFIQDKDGTYRCLATHITFHSKAIKRLPASIKRIINPVLLIIDLLGIWSQQKAHGLAQWSSNQVDGEYHWDRTVKFLNKNALYRPWHIDFFEWNQRLYAIIQSNQCNADICLAESTDKIHFRMFRKPLMTNETCGKIGIYKPTAGVVDGLFYLYYTAQNLDNRSLNIMYLTTMDFKTLLQKLQ